MPPVGITDSEIHLTVCFVVMDVCDCYIGIYVRRCKTDSLQNILKNSRWIIYPVLQHT